MSEARSYQCVVQSVKYLHLNHTDVYKHVRNYTFLKHILGIPQNSIHFSSSGRAGTDTRAYWRNFDWKCALVARSFTRRHLPRAPASRISLSYSCRGLRLILQSAHLPCWRAATVTELPAAPRTIAA